MIVLLLLAMAADVAVTPRLSSPSLSRCAAELTQLPARLEAAAPSFPHGRLATDPHEALGWHAVVRPLPSSPYDPREAYSLSLRWATAELSEDEHLRPDPQHPGWWINTNFSHMSPSLSTLRMATTKDGRRMVAELRVGRRFTDERRAAFLRLARALVARCLGD